MLIIPAIDIIDGRSVRLHRGNYDSAVVYNADPVATAVSFQKAGALRIHIVDLDAARGGRNNRRVIAEIRNRVSAVLEVGGGIRTERDVEDLLALGIDRCILGTVLVREPGVLKKWTGRFGKRFVAGIDARDGEVKTSGWEQGSGKKAEEFAASLADAGAISIIYTNIEKDGTLSGPDLDGTLRIADASGLPVILSGGIGGMEDLERIFRRGDDRIRGVITGKALYEGRVSLPDALDKYQNSNEVEQTW